MSNIYTSMSDNFECSVCGKIFKLKKNLKYHVQNNSCKTTNFICKYCNKTFTTSTSMYRHTKYNCRIKKIEDNKKDEIYLKLLAIEECNKQILAENKLLREHFTNIEKNINKNNINNTTNNVTINNGIVNNITLIAYGREDISKIDKRDILKVFQTGFNSTIKLTETLHFNPKYPEYHNIYISNIKDKYAMLFDGMSWTLTMKEDLINRIYEDKKNYIEENLNDFINSLPPSRKKALERWLETDDDNSKIKEIKDQIRLLLYNKRDIPLRTQNLIETINHQND